MGGYINTVTGPLKTEEMGKTLVHEHTIVDWIGADESGPHRYDRAEVVQRVLPCLEELVDRGYRTFVDCVPACLGRDVTLFRTLSETSGLAIVTNTGYYKEPYIPAMALGMGARELASVWTQEFRDGIGGTGVKPGFVKVAVHAGPLAPMQRTIVTAAALTSLDTGLPVVSHTSDDVSARSQAELLIQLGLPMTSFIIAHADGLSRDTARELGQSGAWLSFDTVGWRPTSFHVDLLEWVSVEGLIGQTLISHDAGWYHVGEAHGGEMRPYTVIEDELLPQIRKATWFSAELEQQLLVDNPARAMSIH